MLDWIWLLVFPPFWGVLMIVLYPVWYWMQTPCNFCGGRSHAMYEPAIIKGYYTRGYNNLCTQASGDDGHYCYCCGKIEWTKSFEEFSASEPNWCDAYPDTEKHRYLGNTN